MSEGNTGNDRNDRNKKGGPKRPAGLTGRVGPRMRQVVGLALGLLALVIVVSAVVGGFAISRLNESRDTVLDHLEPSANNALRLENALIDQETGVRGWIISGDPTFRQPYEDGRAEEERVYETLRRVLPDSDTARADLAEVRAYASTWRTTYAEPALAAGTSGNLPPDAGKGLFDAVRAATATQQEHLVEARRVARADLVRNSDTLTATLIAVAVLFSLLLVVVGMLFRRMVTRPIEHLGEQVRRVRDGDYEHPVIGDGPAEIAELGRDVDLMRDRIVEELNVTRAARALVAEQAEDLRRSNAELEQFAYVASHDLQEPLRKVASFCQLLEKRYKGQMDDRADQYIAFAVDGAKRMQTLINDLLAFSRVGRLDTELSDVDMADCLDAALHSLAGAREESGAQVTTDPLPTIPGDPLLLGQLMQNLVGNGIKFHTQDTPRVHVGAHWTGEMWEFSCVDNGIGIEPQYAERIFIIFQRLHPKDTYGGTGIGLAMCKKIVEYHGGRIWLDADAEHGTTIRWTLPGPAPEIPVVPEQRDEGTDPAGADPVHVDPADADAQTPIPAGCTSRKGSRQSGSEAR